ncbi:MAG: SRPBCC family protein [Ardenticatenaceae bacterium]|nr:SRPBCC family protein [Ardenticatenaceae bacterium]
MTDLTRKIWIDAPKEEVWATLADFGNIYQWNPNVTKSYLTTTQGEGTGTQRHCDLTLAGASVEERIVEWHDGEAMGIEIFDGQKTPPWRNAVATIKIREENGGTEVTGIFSYDMKFGPIGTLMNSMMVKPQFGKAWGELFAGLKFYLETGQKAAHKSELPTDQVVLA